MRPPPSNDEGRAWDDSSLEGQSKVGGVLRLKHVEKTRQLDTGLPGG
jgi:hypothetical protein